MIICAQYEDDLYYLAPFYHLAFPLLDHLVILDVDLEFRYLLPTFSY